MPGVPSRKWAMSGAVCTIHLRLAGASDKQFDQLVRDTLRPARPQLEKRLKESLSQSFGPNLTVSDLCLNPAAREILIRIDAILTRLRALVTSKRLSLGSCFTCRMFLMRPSGTS